MTTWVTEVRSANARLFSGTWRPLVSVITTLLSCDYFLSSSVVSRAFSALCVYPTFGHHPRPIGYIFLPNFVSSRPIRCWASPWGKIAFSITHSSSLFDVREPKRLRFGIMQIRYISKIPRQYAYRYLPVYIRSGGSWPNNKMYTAFTTCMSRSYTVRFFVNAMTSRQCITHRFNAVCLIINCKLSSTRHTQQKHNGEAIFLLFYPNVTTPPVVCLSVVCNVRVLLRALKLSAIFLRHCVAYSHHLTSV